MGKQSGPVGSPSPRKRRDREHQQGQPPRTPTRAAATDMECSTPALGRQAAGASTSHNATNNVNDAAMDTSSAASQAWEGCCSLLREALVDTGSPAAALVPLRPSLRRIKDDLVRVLNEAVSSQNGNASLLVLGPPGTGKTLVVERALQEVCAKHNVPTVIGSSTATTATTAAAAEAAATGPAATASTVAASVRNVGVVRLNGLLQPDERTAFQEVAKQLCRDFGQKFIKSASFDENLVFLKGMLHALYKCLKKVVFVVDEFQQYAKKGKQQMLYYLLDMLQDSKIQAAVIGLSSAHNVAEDLEKRVLSRVGRRRVLITFPALAPLDEAGPSSSNGSPGGSAAARNASAGGGAAGPSSSSPSSEADSYPGLLYDMLALHPGMTTLLAHPGGGLGEAAAEAHNRAAAEALRDTRVADCLSKLALIGSPPQHLSLVAEAALAAWGKDLRRCSSHHHQQQQPQHPAGEAEGSVQEGRRRPAAAAVAAASPAVVMLGPSHILPALRAVTDGPERALVDVVSGLPVLSLVLLVAAHRLQRKGQAMCNFEMAWDEYRSIQGQRGAIAFSKEAAAAAWQALPLSGLAHYVDANIEARGRDLSYAGVVLQVGSAELDQGIREHPHCPDAVTRFHMQEI